MMQTRRKPDHGTFRFAMNEAHEDQLIQKLIGDAQKNKVRPGHAWVRVVAAEGGKDVGHVEYHVDLHTLLVEVVELFGGVETGRRSYDLIDTPS